MDTNTRTPDAPSEFASAADIDWFGDGFDTYMGMNGPFGPSEHRDRGEHPRRRHGRELADLDTLADVADRSGRRENGAPGSSTGVVISGPWGAAHRERAEAPAPATDPASEASNVVQLFPGVRP